MKNTGVLYSSAEKTPAVLPELSELLPPLTDEQSAALEADLLKNGCYAPVIVNEDMVVVDGHNRQRLCEKHGLPYQMAVFAFNDLLEAQQWALEKAKKEVKELDAEADRRGKIAALFCKAYERAVLLTPTEENVRCWTEGTRMTQEELADTVAESRELAGVFSAIADIIEKKILPADWRAKNDGEIDAEGEGGN